MSAMDKILVASDLSPQGDSALQRGAMFARQHNAELHVLYAMPKLSLGSMFQPFRPYGTGHENEHRWIDANREKLHAQALSAARKFHIEIHEHAVTGNPLTQIDMLERVLPADILLLGTGSEGLLRHHVRSTTTALLRHTLRPLLVTKTLEPRQYSSVLVGIGFSVACRNAMETIELVAPAARVTALHALRISAEPNAGRLPGDDVEDEKRRNRALESARKALDDFLAKGRHALHTGRVVEFGDPAKLLADHARRHQADLVVVGKHSYEPVDAQFGTATRRIIERAECDVLVVP